MRANCTCARTAKVGDRQRAQVGIVAAHARNGYVRGELTRGAAARHVLEWCKLAVPPGAHHGTNAILSRRRRCSKSATLRTWRTMKTNANHDELWQVKRRPVEVLIHTGFELRRARARLRRGHSGRNSGSRYYGRNYTPTSYNSPLCVASARTFGQYFRPVSWHLAELIWDGTCVIYALIDLNGALLK